MKKCKLENGLIYYECSAAETTNLGGMGICDMCNEVELHGYLVPVLNSYMCKQCFNEWKDRCNHYPEDDEIEQAHAQYYESMIPLDEEKSK